MFAAPIVAVSLFIVSAPVQAAEPMLIDVVPPTVGTVSPVTFKVNTLVTFIASVTSDHGIDGCRLLVDGKDAGVMRIVSGQASLNQNFDTPATRNVQVRCQDMAGTVGFSPTAALRAQTPDAPPKGYLPAGFKAGMLVRLSCLPGEIDDEHCHNVYYVGQDTKRHGFQSDAAYQSWYPDAPQVTAVSLEALASLPLGEPISVKPGVSAVQFLSQPALTYAVSGPLHLRKFADASVAVSALGADWMHKVDILTDAFYGNFVIGEPLTNARELPVVSSPEDVLKR